MSREIKSGSQIATFLHTQTRTLAVPGVGPRVAAAAVEKLLGDLQVALLARRLVQPTWR